MIGGMIQYCLPNMDKNNKYIYKLKKLIIGDNMWKRIMAIIMVIIMVNIIFIFPEPCSSIEAD